ncbi:class II glutamine amidotransferase [Arhodomonas aquaeolei]|uniref:class II glutamine amidotransferase n=1 Tax=Arhodomonas aquaeolei TaxID=2369 RepID=UPI0003789A1C|nr:class II glutamine amidotransferase [Arhodomonas aquaeolei]
MCELLGMSANVPTDICFSFTGLMQRGGLTGPHRDGWGIAFYEDRGCRIFHDPAPSADSEVARLIQRYSIKSRNVICHIRQGTHGPVTLENTHPFQRELWGRPWAFAHNGRLRGVRRWPMRHYRPIGNTDSEYAFCWLLGELRERFPRPPRRRETAWRYLRQLCARLQEQGTFNMLLSDGQVLHTYCSTHLHWLTRCAPFGEARLRDAEVCVDFAEVTTPDDVVTVIATQPLTDNEVWSPIRAGEMIVFEGGRPRRVEPGARGAITPLPLHHPRHGGVTR